VALSTSLSCSSRLPLLKRFQPLPTLLFIWHGKLFQLAANSLCPCDIRRFGYELCDQVISFKHEPYIHPKKVDGLSCFIPCLFCRLLCISGLCAGFLGLPKSVVRRRPLLGCCIELQPGENNEGYRQDNGNNSDDRGAGLKVRCEALTPSAMRADGSIFWNRLPTVTAYLVLLSYDCPPNFVLG